ncbi:MAG: L,D-transpeptidase family protein [Tissierellaceae bacterium]|nr:L,D-transpeptidase family protein [Tissierellaceae bacterium]
MNRNTYMIYFIFFLILFFLVSGNYIIKISMDKRISSKDVYIKEKPQSYTVHIEVDRKQLKLIDRKNEEIVKSYPIATGKISSPTPLGTFKIVEKAKWGEGFGTRWMGINVPWGIYGIHGTNRPGSIGGNLSAGCIRMRNEDVEELYSLVDYNTLVLITNGIYGPMGQGYRELRPGDRGADVLEVQKRLKQNGYYDGGLDGIYGEGMKTALIKHLKDNNISLTDRITANIYESLGIVLME